MSNPRTIMVLRARKYKWTIVIALMVILFGSGVYVGIRVRTNPDPPDDAVIERYGMTEGFSWVIFNVGNCYKAKNGSSGEIKYSGTNASAVTQAAIDASPNGGKIIIREGRYSYSTALYINEKCIHIKGLPGDINKGGTVLTFSSGVNGFVINSDGTSYTPNVVIEGMLIRGTPEADAGTGILSKGQYVTIRDMTIEYFSVGISLAPATGVAAGDSLIENTVISNCEYQGVKISSNDNRMSNVIIHHCSDGLYLEDEGGLNAVNVHTWGNSANGLKIVKSVFDYFTNLQCDGNQQYGLYIGSCTGDVRSIKFENCWFWCNTNSYPTYLGCVYIGTGSYKIYDVSIVGGKIGDHISGGKLWKGNKVERLFIRNVDLYHATVFGTAWKVGDIKYCKGYVTESSGSAEASHDDWISFGVTFAGIPQTVVITVQESDARYIAQVKAKNTTHFQLYLYDDPGGGYETVDKTISWYAEYQP